MTLGWELETTMLVLELHLLPDENKSISFGYNFSWATYIHTYLHKQTVGIWDWWSFFQMMKYRFYNYESLNLSKNNWNGVQFSREVNSIDIKI